MIKNELKIKQFLYYLFFSYYFYNRFFKCIVTYAIIYIIYIINIWYYNKYIVNKDTFDATPFADPNAITRSIKKAISTLIS